MAELHTSGPPESQPLEMLPFFKAMADATRLKIIGLLATKPRTVEQLAQELGLRSSTVSHHLSRLAGLGLVSARAESYYSIYSLESEAMVKLARDVLSRAREARPEPSDEIPAFDQKVIRDFTFTDGRIKAIPTQRKKRLAILRHVVSGFETGRRYTEKQVNQILQTFSEEEYVTLRRYLVDYGLMDREGGGGSYWRAEQPSQR